MEHAPNFHGKTALISGASAGLGAQFARQLHAEGVEVILVARRKERLEELCAELNTLRANSASFLVADLGSPDLALIEKFLSGNPVDILINNVGFGSFGHFNELDIERECQMVSTNIAVSLRLTHLVVGQMKARGSGVIVNVSSIAGFQPIPYMATYCATKAFNLFHSLALRHELKSHGITVVTLCPGPTDTEFGGVARVPGQITSFKRGKAASVVAATIRGIKKDRAIVVPGLRWKALSLLSRLLPQTFSTFLTERALKGSLEATNSEQL